jgi:hypothetical protein
MYLQKVIWKKVEKHLIFCWLLDEKTRIQIRSQWYGSADPDPVLKCHESTTVL